jgi:hypothetical protein
MTIFRYAIIYNDIPRPAWWRHPIRWLRWRKMNQNPCIGYVDLNQQVEDNGDLVITFGASEE